MLAVGRSHFHVYTMNNSEICWQLRFSLRAHAQFNLEASTKTLNNQTNKKTSAYEKLKVALGLH